MVMQTLLKFLSCLIMVTSLVAFSAEVVPALDVAKLLATTQEYHKDLITKDKPLIDVYENYLDGIAALNGNGEYSLNQLFGKYAFEKRRLNWVMKNFQSHLTPAEVLNDQANLFKEALALSKDNPEIKLKIKVAADCLFRIVKQHYPSTTLDFTAEPPFREKNEKEKQSNKWNLSSSKQSILKSRMVYRAYTGWMTAVCTPFAACFDYLAINHPSIFTRSLAITATLWTGYNGWAYNRIKNLPYPSDEKVYKMWATNLNPKFN